MITFIIRGLNCATEFRFVPVSLTKPALEYPSFG
jgi:hypothetical protein